MAKSEEWIRDGYKYCEKHDQHYRQYCCGCAVDKALGEVSDSFRHKEATKLFNHVAGYQ